MFSRLGISVAKLSGKVKGDERKSKLLGFKARRCRVLVGNIFGEGLDVPQVDVVINAEGGKSRKRTIQRMRNLTPSPGKTYVKVIDFLDFQEPHLLAQSRARVKAYKAEDAFDIRMIKA